jgi:hypothetical protein
MSKKIVKINGYDVRKALGYVYDGCHKFYIIEDEADKKEALDSWGAPVAPLTDDMFHLFLKSCPLRFVSNWKLDKDIIPQSDELEKDSPVEFEFEDETIGIYDPDANYEE